MLLENPDDVIASLSMARGATQSGMTPMSVTARSASDEAVSTCDRGDCFANARSDKTGVISSEAKQSPTMSEVGIASSLRSSQ